MSPGCQGKSAPAPRAIGNRMPPANNGWDPIILEHFIDPSSRYDMRLPTFAWQYLKGAASETVDVAFDFRAIEPRGINRHVEMEFENE